MIQTIELQSTPNQSLKTVLNNQIIDLKFNTANDKLYCDFYLNNTLMQSNIKCNNGVNLTSYIPEFKGFLFFWDISDKEPNYNNFTTTCSLNFSDNDVLTAYYEAWKVANGY